MTEYGYERTEMIREANHRLAYSMRAVGLSAELIIGMARVLPSINVLAIETEAGQSIRQLVQDHLTRYMQGPTSVRGRGLALGATAWGDQSSIGGVLDIDSGQLYDSLVPRVERVSTQPLPDEEWFRHWRGVLAAAAGSLKPY